MDVTPPKLFKREIVRPKFRHRLDRARPLTLAPAPPRPAPGGYTSAGLIAWILLAKYVDHHPFYAGNGIKRTMPGPGLCRVA